MTSASLKFPRLVQALSTAFLLTACSNAPHDVLPLTDPADSPESRIGERLFRDPRFSQLYFDRSAGDVNRVVEGDPVLKTLPRQGGTLQGPFSGQTMACVSCHLVDDATRVAGGSMRAYSDFAERTLISVRSDGSVITTRNTPPLVGTAEKREAPELFHFDGEFSTLEDLVIGGWTGRNFGWLASESATAHAHVAEVLRRDDGKGAVATAFDAMPYALILTGEDPLIPPEYRLSPESRVDVETADDAQVVRAAAHLVGIYLRGLQFAKDLDGRYAGSPYDEFLAANDLPRAPEAGESESAYADRLAWSVARLRNPEWIEGDFAFHKHAYRFGPLEYRGLQTFLARRPNRTSGAPGFERVGNCVACHAPPNFTDFKFHNTGETQDEYDSIHGAGAFVQLSIPNVGAGARDLNQFRAPPSKDHPGVVDLGLWNVAFNPAFPTPQSKIQAILCEGLTICDANEVLPRAIAAFKTAGLRDLGHSDPYLHTGRKLTIEEVVKFYVQAAERARAGKLRNPDPEISKIEIGMEDVEALSAFLRSLDEDYE